MKIATFILGVMQTNCYFIIDEASNQAIVTDPADDFEIIKKKLTERSLSVRYILLTHGHFDHIGALQELREWSKAPVLIHKYDDEMLTDPKKSLMSMYGRTNEAFSPADKLLCDGDTIEFGGKNIRVLHTPGHTKGSCCYIFDENIICGDTLFRANIGRYDFYGGDYDQLMNSLQKLKNLPGDYKIYPGHGASTKLSYERENNIYMR